MGDAGVAVCLGGREGGGGEGVGSGGRGGQEGEGEVSQFEREARVYPQRRGGEQLRPR